MAATPIACFFERLARDGPVFAVQIGANDGISNDPIRTFIERYGWQALLVEPLPDIFARLEQNYRGFSGVRLANCAIGPEGPLTLYRVQAEVGNRFPWLHELASFDRDVVLRHQVFFPDLARYVVEEKVPCLPFSTLMERHDATGIDALVVDTEGYDFEILRQVDFKRYRPRIVLYEHKHLSPEIRAEAASFLASAGYATIPEEYDTLGLLQDWVAEESPIAVHEVFAHFAEELRTSRQLLALIAPGGTFRVTRATNGTVVITKLSRE